MSGVLVRPMVAEDAPAVLRIYHEGIDDGSCAAPAATNERNLKFVVDTG